MFFMILAIIAKVLLTILKILLFLFVFLVFVIGLILFVPVDTKRQEDIMKMKKRLNCVYPGCFI